MATLDGPIIPIERPDSCRSHPTAAGQISASASIVRHILDSDLAAIDPVVVKTKDLKNGDGILIGFTVSNLLLRRRGVGRIVRSISGARIIREQPRFRLGGRDDFLEFKVDGRTFLAIEPFGDNSEFWIVSQPPGEMLEQLRQVREAFGKHRPMLGSLPSGKRPLPKRR